MNSYIQLTALCLAIIFTAIVAAALVELAWQLYFAARSGLKCLNSCFKRRELVNKEACERFVDLLRQFAEVAGEVDNDAKVNILNRDDSVQYATLGDIPEKEQIHHRIVRVGGEHPVDYIYNSKTKEWNTLFGDISLGYGSPVLMMKDIHDLNIKTRIPGQKICVPEAYRMYEIGADGEVIPLPDEDVIQQSFKEVTNDGQSN